MCGPGFTDSEGGRIFGLPANWNSDGGYGGVCVRELSVGGQTCQPARVAALSSLSVDGPAPSPLSVALRLLRATPPFAIRPSLRPLCPRASWPATGPAQTRK